MCLWLSFNISHYCHGSSIAWCLVPGAWCLVTSGFEKKKRCDETDRHVHQVARSRHASAGGDTFCTCTLWRDNIPTQRSLPNSLPVQRPQSPQSKIAGAATVCSFAYGLGGKSRTPEITDFAMPSSMKNWHQDSKKPERGGRERKRFVYGEQHPRPRRPGPLVACFEHVSKCSERRRLR